MESYLPDELLQKTAEFEGQGTAAGSWTDDAGSPAQPLLYT